MSLNLGSDSKSFAFDTIGATISGTIVTLEERQQTDMDDGAPAVWPDGRPKMQVVVTLKTTEGEQNVYLRGSKKPESCSSLAAVIAAVKAATGGSSIDEGAMLALTYIGDGEAPKRGYNAPKRYSAKYQAPSKGVDLGTHASPGDAAGVAGLLTGHPQYASLKAAGLSDEQITGALGL